MNAMGAGCSSWRRTEQQLNTVILSKEAIREIGVL